MTDEEAFRMLIESALRGNQRAEQAAEFLRQQLTAGQFNTERAVEVYKIAVDNAVWDSIRSLPARSAMYRDYWKSGLGKAYALKLAQEFKEHNSAKDQRPTRKFLRADPRSC